MCASLVDGILWQEAEGGEKAAAPRDSGGAEGQSET